MLFAALAAVMMLTRRIDWYALFARLRAEVEPTAEGPAARSAK
jgi:inner membrane protein involved in colicin E2 resistance